jgi:hypothetical protein
MLSRSVLKRFSAEDRGVIRDGGILLGVLFGGIGYYNYREFIKKDFLRSEAHYRFNSTL